eukprot:s779_g8.t1
MGLSRTGRLPLLARKLHSDALTRWLGVREWWHTGGCRRLGPALVKELGLEGGNGVDSPSTAQHTVRSFSDIASGMANPTILHMLKIKRLGRYLLKHPPEIWEFEYQETPKSVCVMSDSDRATCKTTRKSMSSSMERFGAHVIDASYARQSVVALSSGEAEFYALTRSAAIGRTTKQIWDVIGFPGLPLVVKTDSTAAKGIAGRKGVGRVKHLLDLRDLWVQDLVARGDLRVEKEPTDTNWADLGTKPLSGEDEEPTWSLSSADWFLVYLVMVHLYLLWCIFRCIFRFFSRRNQKAVTHEVGTCTSEDWKERRPESSPPAIGESGHGGASSSSQGPVATAAPVAAPPTAVPTERNVRERRPRNTDPVYLTVSGQRFHKNSCGDLNHARRMRPGSVTQVPRHVAISSGYTPCGNCGGQEGLKALLSEARLSSCRALLTWQSWHSATPAGPGMDFHPGSCPSCSSSSACPDDLVCTQGRCLPITAGFLELGTAEWTGTMTGQVGLGCGSCAKLCQTNETCSGFLLRGDG